MTLKAAGFLAMPPSSGFDAPSPSDALGPDEDPYTFGEEPDDLATGNLNLDEAQCGASPYFHRACPGRSPFRRRDGCRSLLRPTALRA